ncbi:MAG: rab guanine nucleotide exchange factor S2 [Chaenotheca gracillima]|nr:MAG: rab guanine nucleotide exchange factor S2 [Chaenotheca gracillima]
MSGAARQAAGKIAQASATAEKRGGGALSRGAKRDPELYILLAIMSGAFGLAGFYFGHKPTSSSSEQSVGMAENSMPWQKESSKGDGNKENFKYQYHPGGDPKNAPKDAPSALHSVIVPNVTLPKKLHDQFNKYGRDDF